MKVIVSVMALAVTAWGVIKVMGTLESPEGLAVILTDLAVGAALFSGGVYVFGLAINSQ